MKKLFSTSLLILAGMLLLLGSCKEDELPVSGEGNVANNELPVRLAETDYNPDNTYYLLNDNESQDVYFDSGQRSFYVSLFSSEWTTSTVSNSVSIVPEP